MRRAIFVFLLTSGVACNAEPEQDRPPRPALTVAEAAVPARVGGTLCHPAIGFAISDPGLEYRERPDLGGTGGNLATWVWESDQTHERLLIMAVKAIGATPDAFREYAAGARKGLLEHGDVEAESVEVDEVPYVLNLDGRLGNGNSYSTRCIGTGPDNPWTICASTVSLDHETLRPLRESLAASACPQSR